MPMSATQMGGTTLESSSFDRLTRLIGSSTGRRTALAASAATGLAALTAGTAEAQSPRERIKNRLPKGRRGKRGKRGKPGRNGKNGAPGPRAGAGIKVVTEVCDPPELAQDQSHDCTISCGSGFVATGGGYDVGDLLPSLIIVRASMPDLDADNVPQGWTVQIRAINPFNPGPFEIYAVCVPA